MKFIHDGHFEFQHNLKKSLAHLHVVGNMIVKFEYFPTVSSGVFAPTKKIRVAVILNFGSIFKKSLANPHVARHVMLNFEKKLNRQFF